MFEVPAGVVADTISRKWSLVVSHVLMGTAMIATSLVTDFRPLVATQMLWGLSWTLASGADVAGIALPLTRTIGTVGRTEIVCGLAIAVIARFAGLSLALVSCAALFAITIFLIRPRPEATNDYRCTLRYVISRSSFHVEPSRQSSETPEMVLLSSAIVPAKRYAKPGASRRHRQTPSSRLTS